MGRETRREERRRRKRERRRKEREVLEEKRGAKIRVEEGRMRLEAKEV